MPDHPASAGIDMTRTQHAAARERIAELEDRLDALLSELRQLPGLAAAIELEVARIEHELLIVWRSTSIVARVGGWIRRAYEQTRRPRVLRFFTRAAPSLKAP